MKRKLFLLPILAGFVLGGCSFEDLMFWKKKSEEQQQPQQDQQDQQDQQVEPKVNSVTITGSKSTLGLDQTLQLGVSVSIEGTASKDVVWSSSNVSVATVSSSGLVKPVAEGKVTITAASTFDTSKQASVVIEIVDRGPYPEIYEEGFDYTKTFPSKEAKDFVGIDVPSFETEEGFYVHFYEAETVTIEGEDVTYPEQLNIRFAYTEKNYAAVYDALAEFYSFYDPFYEVESWMNVGQTIQFDLEPEYISEDSYDYVYSLTLYKTSDIYSGNSTNTTDTAWKTDVATALAGIGLDLPFVKLGADYIVDTESGILIADFCSDYTKLESYESSLLGASFEKVESEEDGVYYVKGIDKYTEAYVQFAFTGYGNTIMVSSGLRKFAGYPATEVAAFVDSFESIYDVTEFTQNSEALYTYEETEETSATVSIYGVTEAQCNSYVEALVADEFVLDTENSITETDGVSVAYLQKGKILVSAIIVYGTRDANAEELAAFAAITEEEFNAMSLAEMIDYIMKSSELEETGTFQVTDYDKVAYAMLMISADPTAREVPGLYVDSENVSVSLGGTLALEVEPFKLGENPVLNYASSNNEIATVNSEGVVTAVAEGTCDITVSTDYNETHYEIVVHVSVVNEVTDVITLSKLGRTETNKTTYADFSNVHDASSAVYAGQCAADHDSIQIRSKNSNSGIYSTTSGGTIKEVNITFNSNDANTNGLKIIGSHEPLESISAAFSATALATVTNQDGVASYTFEEDYEYVAIISASGAHYLDSIEFVWLP